VDSGSRTGAGTRSRGRWDGERLSHPTVVRDGDGYRMYYGGRDRRGTSAIGLATSPDGVTWTKHDDPSTPSSSDPVLVAAGVWDAGTIARPRVVPHDDGWLLLYAAAAIGTGSVGLATSADGVSWDPHPENPILARGAFGRALLFDYALIPFDGRLLWLFEYGGGSTRTDLYALELIRPDALSRMEVTATVSGDTVDVEVTAAGITLDFVAGDTSAATAHPHVFVDRARPFPGEEVPLGDPTIVHARGNTLSVAGLEPGSHTLWVVLANGADEVLAPPAPIQLVVMIEAAD